METNKKLTAHYITKLMDKLEFISDIHNNLIEELKKDLSEEEQIKYEDTFYGGDWCDITDALEDLEEKYTAEELKWELGDLKLKLTGSCISKLSDKLNFIGGIHSNLINEVRDKLSKDDWEEHEDAFNDGEWYPVMDALEDLEEKYRDLESEGE